MSCFSQITHTHTIPMKKTHIFLLVPLFFINSAFMLMGGCFSVSESPYCEYYNSGYVIAWNNAGANPRLANDSGVIAKALKLNLIFNDTSYLCMVHHHYIYDGAPYAFKKPYREKFTYIDSIRIVSDNYFDASHPAGTNLMDLFSNPDLNAGIRRINKDTTTLFLLRPPADTGTHIFTITTYTADTLKNITLTSLPIKLLL